MADIWTDKHDTGIQRTYDLLLQEVQSCKDASQLEGQLVQGGWLPGKKPTSTVQQGVRHTIGLWVKVKRLEQILGGSGRVER